MYNRQDVFKKHIQKKAEELNDLCKTLGVVSFMSFAVKDNGVSTPVPSTKLQRQPQRQLQNRLQRRSQPLPQRQNRKTIQHSLKRQKQKVIHSLNRQPLIQQ